MTQSQFAAVPSQGGTDQVLPAAEVIKYAGTGGCTFAISGSASYQFAQLDESDVCMAGMLRHSIREHREHTPGTAAVSADVWVTLHAAAGDGFDCASADVAKGSHGAGLTVTARARVVVEEDGLALTIPVDEKELESAFIYWGDFDEALGLALCDARDASDAGDNT